MDGLVESPSEPIPDLLNRIFHVVDARIAQIGYKRKQFSGCTAVTAFLRVEENVDKPPFGFANPAITTRGLLEEKDLDEDEEERRSRRSSMGAGSSGSMGGAATPEPSVRRKLSSRRIRDFVRGLTGRMQEDESAIEDDHSSEERVEAIEPKSSHGLRRVLYTANVGDARAVLSRSGKAVRLTYDHKGSDAQEAKRIMDAGGFMMNNRVNGGSREGRWGEGRFEAGRALVDLQVCSLSRAH